eukprot:2459162-Rhodomonas_salina.1
MSSADLAHPAIVLSNVGYFDQVQFKCPVLTQRLVPHRQRIRALQTLSPLPPPLGPARLRPAPALQFR